MLNDDLGVAAAKLHRYLADNHWNGSALVGPDPGIRLNARIGRFLKSYLRFLPWSDDMTYMQAQGYWVLDNWLLSVSATDEHANLARLTSRTILASQRPGGFWDYPNREWRGRVATVEGCFAALALLETHRRTGDESLLAGALRWHDFVELEVGFRPNPGGDAVNYFAGESGSGGVPNNSTLYLWFLASLAERTGDAGFLGRAESLLAWLGDVQLPSGELPYAVGGVDGADRPHFLCQQYNAFEFMDLAHYHRLTGDPAAWPIMERLAGYLATGLAPSGYARHSCLSDGPVVMYYTAAVAQALGQAATLAMGDHSSKVDAAYARLLEMQRPDGSFQFYSRGNYRVLADRRSYPRYQAMVLHHLILEQRRRAHAPLQTQSGAGE